SHPPPPENKEVSAGAVTSNRTGETPAPAVFPARRATAMEMPVAPRRTSATGKAATSRRRARPASCRVGAAKIHFRQQLQGRLRIVCVLPSLIRTFREAPGDKPIQRGRIYRLAFQNRGRLRR